MAVVSQWFQQVALLKNKKIHFTKKKMIMVTEVRLTHTHFKRQGEGRIQILPIQYPTRHCTKRWLDSFTASSQRWVTFCIFLKGRHKIGNLRGASSIAHLLQRSVGGV